MTRRTFLPRLAALLGAALLLLPTGCGSGGSSGTRFGAAPPASFGYDRFRPNYGGDLTATNFWPAKADGATEVTYRIMTQATGATDIRLNPIGNIDPTPRQAQDIRDGFQKWQTALSANPPESRRTFREVPATEYADIDVVVQLEDQFSGREDAFYEQYGQCNYWLRDAQAGHIGRAVIRIRADLAERVFRFTILHEEGHSLGMLGHSRRQGVVMQAIQFPVVPIVELDRYDVNTVCALYAR